MATRRNYWSVFMNAPNSVLASEPRIEGDAQPGGLLSTDASGPGMRSVLRSSMHQGEPTGLPEAGSSTNTPADLASRCKDLRTVRTASPSAQRDVNAECRKATVVTAIEFRTHRVLAIHGVSIDEVQALTIAGVIRSIVAMLAPLRRTPPMEMETWSSNLPGGIRFPELVTRASASSTEGRP